MSFSDFMTKVRQLDTQAARWMMRHFYILFFELVLVIIFFVFLFSTFHTIDLAQQTPKDNVMEQLLLQQSTNTHIIIILMLLNSFWMLYVFNEISRVRTILKDISFYQSRRPAQK